MGLSVCGKSDELTKVESLITLAIDLTKTCQSKYQLFQKRIPFEQQFFSNILQKRKKKIFAEKVGNTIEREKWKKQLSIQ